MQGKDGRWTVETVTSRRKPSFLEGAGRVVTAMSRTSGTERGWTYLTVRLDDARYAVTVLGPAGELLGHAAADDGDTAYIRATGLGLGFGLALAAAMGLGDSPGLAAQIAQGAVAGATVGCSCRRRRSLVE